MKIILSSDHAGFELKEKLLIFLKKAGLTVVDYGPHKNDPEDDYPDFVAPVASEVSENPDEVRGIVIGGSGQGEAMVANRFPHVRAVVFYGEPIRKDVSNGLDIITLSREHNNANILSLGGRFLKEDEARQAVMLWLDTPFSEDFRHIRRLEKADHLFNKQEEEF